MFSTFQKLISIFGVSSNPIRSSLLLLENKDDETRTTTTTTTTVYYTQKLLDEQKVLLGLKDNNPLTSCQYLIDDECNNNISSITHCRQETIWDCGVTCCQMVLRWILLLLLQLHHDTLGRTNDGNHNDENDDLDYEVDMDYDYTPYGYSSKLTDIESVQRKWMLESLNTQSIWTIDLVVLLHTIFRNKFKGTTYSKPEEDPTMLFQTVAPQNNMDISLLFCTKKIGVDDTHKDLNYYEGDFLKDADRVKSLFQFSRDEKIPILETDYMQLAHVVDFVSRSNCIAIALLDNNILLEGGGAAAAEQSRFLHDMKRRARSTMWKKSFTGHYVVICGISTKKRDIAECQWQDKGAKYCFIVKNPGSVNATDFISPSHFEKVRVGHNIHCCICSSDTHAMSFSNSVYMCTC